MVPGCQDMESLLNKCNLQSCNLGHWQVHMDGTVETLTFADKATRVTNCFKADEVGNYYAIILLRRKQI